MKCVDLRINKLLTTLILSTSAVLNANAQTVSQPLKTLGDYRPTVLYSENEAGRIYHLLPTKTFKGSSGCYQRAHNWAYDLSQFNDINSMKVFLFFTERYKREFDYSWMYHVAPLIPVRMNDGSTQELVFDPTFVNVPSWADEEEKKYFDNKPITIERWIRYFIAPKVECPLIENYQDYFNYQERYYCYIMKTPMFTYIPENIEAENEVRTQWREGDLKQMKKAFRLELKPL